MCLSTSLKMALFLPRENIMLVRAANNLAAILCRNVSSDLAVMDLTHSVLNYTQTFELEYGVPFIHEGIGEIGRVQSVSDFSVALETTNVYVKRASSSCSSRATTSMNWC